MSIQCTLSYYQAKKSQANLRLLDTYASKIAKICDLKTFWPLIYSLVHEYQKVA